MVEKVRTIPEFVDKTEAVWSEDELVTMLKGAKTPMAGIVYNGLSANSGDPSRQGLTADLTVSIFVLVEGNSIGRIDEKPEAARLLDVIRDKILTKTSPTGHKWRFVREVPQGKTNNKLVFVQTWATATVMTNKTNLRPTP